MNEIHIGSRVQLRDSPELQGTVVDMVRDNMFFVLWDGESIPKVYTKSQLQLTGR